jgi:hypothetical protein
MSTSLLSPQLQTGPRVASIQEKTEGYIDDLFNSLPTPKSLTSEERRGIIARYTAVLEGNFIYWMTATLLAIQSEESKPIILDNLNEEIREAHPVMLRKFAIAAHAFPTDKDALAINTGLNKMRRFLGRLSSVESVLSMAFFEGFIQKFMSYLADLASEQGSTEMEYTDVHGVCDVAHTQGLFNAFAVEMALNPPAPETDLFEGVTLLRDLIEDIIHPQPEQLAA